METDTEVSLDDLAKWVKRLERFASRFEEKSDHDNEQLMLLCAALVTKFAFDLEVQTATPFPLKAGSA